MKMKIEDCRYFERSCWNGHEWKTLSSKKRLKSFRFSSACLYSNYTSLPKGRRIYLAAEDWEEGELPTRPALWRKNRWIFLDAERWKICVILTDNYCHSLLEIHCIYSNEIHNGQLPMSTFCPHHLMLQNPNPRELLQSFPLETTTFFKLGEANQLSKWGRQNSWTCITTKQCS